MIQTPKTRRNPLQTAGFDEVKTMDDRDHSRCPHCRAPMLVTECDTIPVFVCLADFTALPIPQTEG